MWNYVIALQADLVVTFRGCCLLDGLKVVPYGSTTRKLRCHFKYCFCEGLLLLSARGRQREILLDTRCGVILCSTSLEIKHFRVVIQSCWIVRLHIKVKNTEPTLMWIRDDRQVIETREKIGVSNCDLVT